MPFKAKNNREAVVVCAIHVVKRPSKRSVLVYNKIIRSQRRNINHNVDKSKCKYLNVSVDCPRF